MTGERSNSSIVFDKKYFLKIVRKLEEGINPDVEITRFLTNQADFPTCRLAECSKMSPRQIRVVFALIQSAVANENDAWISHPRRGGQLSERVLSRKAAVNGAGRSRRIEELTGGVYPEKARLLGQRTGEITRRCPE